MPPPRHPPNTPMSEKKKFLLRIDNTLYNALEKWASDDLRSINAQIEFILTNALRTSGRTAKKSADGEQNDQ